MPITINGSGTIGGISVGGLPDGIVDNDTLASGTPNTAALPAGSILQVVQGSTETQVNVSTTTYTDTGLSASITPTSNTSKILVLVNQQFSLYRTAETNYAGIRVYRDSTVIHSSVEDSTGPYDYSISVGDGSSVVLSSRAVISLLDSPGSTSLLTYKTQGRPYFSSSSGLIAFNQTGSTSNTKSYIILLEVAA
jgi:hypothetical protein